MLVQTSIKELSYSEKLELLEDHLLDYPQVECPVIHHFGPGIYIREVHLPAGTLAIGHAQRFEHLNIMLTGAVAMTDDDGQLKIVRAPLIFIGEPGRKFGYVLEDTIWQNVYATTETDIDKLEATYLDKSETWQTHDDKLRELRTALHFNDRQDFELLLTQINLSADEVRAQSENDTDQIPMPAGCAPKFTVRDSYIEGKGVFLSASAEPGELIAPARLNGMRTPAGRYTNHSKTPNARFELSDNGDIYLVASHHINGCVGGGQGDEVTVNYRQALSLAGIEIQETSL
jgi:hypothetical protein